MSSDENVAQTLIFPAKMAIAPIHRMLSMIFLKSFATKLSNGTPKDSQSHTG